MRKPSSLCIYHGCRLDATHGVTYLPTRGAWVIRAGRYIAQARKQYCRWYATVQAVCRNAEKRAHASSSPGRDAGLWAADPGRRGA